MRDKNILLHHIPGLLSIPLEIQLCYFVSNHHIQWNGNEWNAWRLTFVSVDSMTRKYIYF